MTAGEALKKYFGYDDFREGQQTLIECILKGKDVLGIMPTGAGKSVCFQLPAMIMDGVVLVISPLISLMKDQVETLIQSGLPAAYINSSQSTGQMRKVMDRARAGKYKLIYVAPERLLTHEFLSFAKNTEIAMVTVDEAHCISQWGQDFRPSYSKIPDFLKELPKRPVVSGFTATATSQVRNDIIELLSLKQPEVLISGFNRENLFFEVQNPKDKFKALLGFLEDNKDESGIIYCSTRKTVEAVCEQLRNRGFSAAHYHAGLSDDIRHKNQEDFIFDRVNLIVATNAFGMGIDKSNVSFVIHYNMPKDIESYYQEAGRAGRDGSPANCLMLYSGQDVRTNQWLIENTGELSGLDEHTAETIRERSLERLKQMTFYSTGNECLRGFILKYFGEKPEIFCGKCSNCNTKFDRVDITETAQKILSCIYRMEQRFGENLVIDVLRGSKNKRIFDLGFNELSTYGICRDSVQTLKNVINYLDFNGYLLRSNGQYPVLQLSSKSKDILSGGETLVMKMPKERVRITESKIEFTADKGIVDKEMFIRLRNLRFSLAKKQGVPAYVIFTDKSIIDMCVKMPKTMLEFADVYGVGENKLRAYGEIFLKEINR